MTSTFTTTTTTTTPAVAPDLIAFVRAASPIAHRLGGAWFFAEPVQKVGADAGLTDGFALYAAGRGGVLGDCDPAVVASAFAFFPPPVVLAKYAEAVAVLPPRECTRVYARGLASWGEELFGDVPGIERLAELGRRIADSVLPMGMPMFAGWRAEPVPPQPAAAAAQALQVLRELRGDKHIQSIAALQLTPLQAILGGDGPRRARELHYPEPFPAPEEFIDRRRAAEDLTDRLVAPAYAALTPTEQNEMLELLNHTQRALN